MIREIAIYQDESGRRTSISINGAIEMLIWVDEEKTIFYLPEPGFSIDADTQKLIKAFKLYEKEAE